MATALDVSAPDSIIPVQPRSCCSGEVVLFALLQSSMFFGMSSSFGACATASVAENSTMAAVKPQPNPDRLLLHIIPPKPYTRSPQHHRSLRSLAVSAD